MNIRLAVAAVTLAAALPAGAQDYTTPQSGAFSDAQIVNALQTANLGEAQAAELALQKASRSDVKGFARRMKRDHSSSQEKLSSLAAERNITPAESDYSASLRQHSQESLSSLRPLSGADFDRAYMDAMVADHQALLDAIDNRMIPNVRDEKLSSTLRRKREVVSDHLRDARRIQSRIAGGRTTFNDSDGRSGESERAVGPQEGRYPDHGRFPDPVKPELPADEQGRDVD